IADQNDAIFITGFGAGDDMRPKQRVHIGKAEAIGTIGLFSIRKTRAQRRKIAVQADSSEQRPWIDSRERQIGEQKKRQSFGQYPANKRPAIAAFRSFKPPPPGHRYRPIPNSRAKTASAACVSGSANQTHPSATKWKVMTTPATCQSIRRR